MKKIKIALLGVGLMGKQHLKAIYSSKKATLHSIIDINPRSKKFADKYKVPFYNDSFNLLKNYKPDAAIVATHQCDRPRSCSRPHTRPRDGRCPAPEQPRRPPWPPPPLSRRAA